MNWEYLKEGDIVDIVAPGFRSTSEEFRNAIRFLKKWKLVPRYPKNIFDNHFLHSNSDDMRFEFFKKALLAKDSKAIWCLRGGYGSNRLLPMLNKLKKPKHCKLVIGISDITSIHTFLNQKWGWNTLHAPLLDRMGAGKVPDFVQKETKEVIFGNLSEVKFQKIRPINKQALKLKSIAGKMKGGNLIVLQSSVGTPNCVSFANSIVFFEDLGERGYRIDRVLEHFKQAGLFKNCKAVIFGDFLGGEEPSTGRNNFKHVFARFASEVKFPVFTGLEAGHGVIQRPVPLNSQAKIYSDGKTYKLVIQTGGR